MPINSGVTVAGNLLSSYGAYMQANPIISHIRDVETFQGRQRSTMLPVKNLITGMQLKAKIDFIGTAATRAMNRSNFEALFRSQTDPVVIDILDGFFYRAVLLSAADCGTVYDMINTVEYVWQVTRHTTSVTKNLVNGITINCISNFDRTDCIIEIAAGYFGGEDSLLITINGYRWGIQGLDNPQEKAIVLDGINKRFLIGNDNAANVISWQDFPFLVPGDNTIGVSVSGYPVTTAFGTVSYTPTYL